MDETTTATLRSIHFQPDVLARIAPDVSLQKHLQIGLRPSLRKFEEFKPVSISNAGIGRYESHTEGSTNNGPGLVLGSSILKSGSTTVITTVSAGIVEDEVNEYVNDYRLRLDNDIIEAEDDEDVTKMERYCSVYTNVEILNGNNGNGMGGPSEEEKSIGQKIFDVVRHSRLINKDAVKINLGLKAVDDNKLIYQDGDDVELNGLKKRFSYVLYANIQVFSRTGPLFDLCYSGLLTALQNTKLPVVYIDEEVLDIKVPGRGGFGNNHNNRSSYNLICDPKLNRELILEKDKLGWSSSFGIVDLKNEFEDQDPDQEGQDGMDVDLEKRSVLLADLEGEAEEEISKRIHVISDGKNTLFSVTINNDDGFKITKELIKRSIELSKRRAKDTLKK